MALYNGNHMKQANKTHGWIIDHTYYKNEDEQHKLRMCGGSWTINLNELTGEHVLNFEYRTNRAVYRVDFETVRKHGFKRELGGEPKMVVPVSVWNVKILQ